ncbi:MAG TPA: acylneuraminate cytidylyltransferase family protein [Chitinophagaceae bacterium]|nr:acylneuraminate cytidylyltransferase family protein [Chitinophagaceae bacterium]
MRILAIIPARRGSKGVPGKNSKMLNGTPLIDYTINAAKSSRLLSRCIISTDSEEIAAIGAQNGVEAPFIRPSHLAQDDTPTLPVVQHAINFFADRGEAFDAVCILQPTYPFRVPGFIDMCIQKFIETGADTLISVLPVPHQYNPHWVFEKNENGFLHIATNDEIIIPRRQQLPEAFIRDGNIYIAKTRLVMDASSLFGKNIAFEISGAGWYVNIDTPADWDVAEQKAAAYRQAFSRV